jgi:hypothetical protein
VLIAWAVTHPRGRLPLQALSPVRVTSHEQPAPANAATNGSSVVAEPEQPAPATPPAPRTTIAGARIYVTDTHDQIEVTDGDIALLASGEMTPGAGALAELCTPHQEFADNEALGWRKAEHAAAKPERERTDDEKMSIA